MEESFKYIDEEDEIKETNSNSVTKNKSVNVNKNDDVLDELPSWSIEPEFELERE